jgi:hypothetical protein
VARRVTDRPVGPASYGWRIERREKFKIIHRDNFTCRYCGARPGSENLEVDHVIPRSRHGSNNACNLVAACITCNSRKSDTIIFPSDMIERDDTTEGWKVHKSFGVWAVKFSDEMVVIEDDTSWWFDVTRLLCDNDFVRYHIREKLDQCWERQKSDDFADCLRYVEQMIASLEEDR